MDTKRCQRCKKDLDIALFEKKGDKLVSKCNECVEKVRESYYKNGEPKPGMVCEKCFDIGIITRSSYGYDNGPKIRCVKHKDENMIDLAHKNQGCETCKSEGKFKRASFGYPE